MSKIIDINKKAANSKIAQGTAEKAESKKKERTKVERLPQGNDEEKLFVMVLLFFRSNGEG